jgi:uncharacterized protein
LVNRMDEWKSKTVVRVSVETLKYIVRSGRVSPVKGFIAKLLDLKPVIAVDSEGKASLFSKSFSGKGSMKQVMKNISKITSGKKIWEYAITHANNSSGARWYAEEMEKLTGKKPVFIDHASPALAANTGPGIACVSLMLE